MKKKIIFLFNWTSSLVNYMEQNLTVAQLSNNFHTFNPLALEMDI